MNEQPLCLVIGVGPGTGSAVARRFGHEGYRIGLASRTRSRLDRLSQELPGSVVLPVDVSDKASIEVMVKGLEKHGVPKVVIYNAVVGTFGDYLDVDPAALETNFRTNVMGLLYSARALIPRMAEAGGGAFVATGNTSAYRGKADFAAFAPTKAAQRILLEAIARRSGADGVHCAYVAIDAVIDLAWTRKMAPNKPDDFFSRPEDIADEVYRIAHQPRSAWSFDSVIRPFGEEW